MIYAGIGPRNTPEAVRNQMTYLGKQLEEMGFILSSGHGIGADQAWAEEVQPEHTRIFLPAENPSCPHGVVADILEAQWDFADLHFGKHRKDFKNQPLSLNSQNEFVQRLFCRNLNILLGADLAEPEPVDFVAYWYHKDFPHGWASGTGHTVSMARDKEINIQCFNINNAEDCKKMEKLVDKLIAKGQAK